MRPLVLELHGFGPFRAPTTIDFRDHELIALTGPTGAGKSSIIDGIGFALYGSIARYDNAKLVAPVINAVSSEARVRLDFSVGETEYTAVRIVRRSANGASTKEARLEQGDEVIASNAQQVGAAIEEIVGLTFSQFTKTVVLPQGDFAQFLNVKPSGRQQLLRHLLGLDVFAEVGKAARVRARTMQSQLDVLTQPGAASTLVEPGEVEALTDRVAELEVHVSEVEAANQTRLTAIDEQASMQTKLDDLAAQLERLEQLTIPDDAKSFASTITAAEKARDQAQTKLEAAEKKHGVVLSARDELPATAELDTLLDTYEQNEIATGQLTTTSEQHARAMDVLNKATNDTEQATISLASAEDDLEHARHAAGAHGIAASLHVGDECPVCTQIVGELPNFPTAKKSAAVVTKAEAARTKARVNAEAKMNALKKATAQQADSAARLEGAELMVAQIAEVLADEPTLKQTLALQKRALAADTKLETAAERLALALEAVTKTCSALDEVMENETMMRRSFTEARDSVVALGPPKPSEDSLQNDWSELAAWAKATAREVKAELRILTKSADAARKALDNAEKVLGKLMAPHVSADQDFDTDQALPAVQKAHTDARVLLANAQDRADRQVTTHDQIQELERERLRAEVVGKHLASGMFEQWIMGDVMADLAERASSRLERLSHGAYSLTTDSKSFQIRDHRNADELRNARTLSGGETFLTSLALALALSDSIAELAATSTPPLESMFLDEGFATLDAETLDTVAAAIEELGSSGKLVGVVTHLPDLAERIPTRFQVKPSPTGSTVEIPETAVR